MIRFAQGLRRPRCLHALPNRDVLLSRASSVPANKAATSAADKAKVAGMRKARSIDGNRNMVLLLCDADGQAEIRHVLNGDLQQPFGMAALGDKLDIAAAGGLYRYPFNVGSTSVGGPGELLLPLPVGGYNNHWTRNVVAPPCQAAVRLGRLRHRHRRGRGRGRGGDRGTRARRRATETAPGCLGPATPPPGGRRAANAPAPTSR